MTPQWHKLRSYFDGSIMRSRDESEAAIGRKGKAVDGLGVVHQFKHKAAWSRKSHRGEGKMAGKMAGTH